MYIFGNSQEPTDLQSSILYLSLFRYIEFERVASDDEFSRC